MTTATTTAAPPPSAPRSARLLRTVAVLGVIAAVAGGLSGWVLLDRLGSSLDASLSLTEDALVALDASAGIAADTVDTLGASLRTLETTADELEGAFDDGELLMSELAVIIEEDVAGSLRAVEDALPAVTSAARVVDTTLASLQSLPFVDVSYDPERTLGGSLGALEESVQGLPDRLVEQAALLQTTAEQLGDVGTGVTDLATELAAFEQTLASTSDVLATYDETITEGQALVAETSEDLGSQIRIAKAALVLLALAFAAVQAAPWQLADVQKRLALLEGASSSNPRG